MCAKTIQAFPRSGPAWIIAGNLQEYCYCNEEMAQTCYQTAIDYGYTFGYYHLAVSLSKVGRYKEAEECYKRLLEIAPDEDYVQAGLGMLYLTLKNMNGYEYFFKREKTDEVKSLKNPWHGQTLENERVLLYCDHGYGDIIQFIRYLPQLSKKINNIIVKTRPELMNLLRRSYPEDKYPNVKFISETSKEMSSDKFVLSTDLPYYLNLDFNHIPYPEGYLTVDISKKNYFKEKYFNNDKLKVGLCWKAGGYGMRTDVNRTINIEYFDKILGINKVQFYSFQKNDIFDGCNKYSQITDLKEELKDFDDTASAISNLDLMITADTSCLHISGAIGKKTYLLLPYCADWRWFENDKTTEWYNSVEIFKQQDRQDWYIEADKIYERLKEIIG